MGDSYDRMEQVASEFGNGAHVTVPKEWEGDIIDVERVCPFVPHQFSDVEEGGEVVVDLASGETISGEVMKFDVSTNQDNKGVSLNMKIDTGHDFYRIEGERSVGEESWGSEFDVSKAVSGDEAYGADGIVSLEVDEGQGEMWHPEGTLKSIAVKQTIGD